VVSLQCRCYFTGAMITETLNQRDGVMSMPTPGDENISPEFQSYLFNVSISMLTGHLASSAFESWMAQLFGFNSSVAINNTAAVASAISGESSTGCK